MILVYACKQSQFIKFVRSHNCTTYIPSKLNFLSWFTGQSGNIRAFDYPQAPKYPVRETIQFDPPFDETPAMMYALNFIDVNYAENFRVNSSLMYVDRYRAQLQMSTWHDTKLYGIGLSWMACPWKCHMCCIILSLTCYEDRQKSL